MTDEEKLLPCDERLVEPIARIIEPSMWATMDGYLEQTKRKYHGQNVMWPVSQFQHKESMAKARSIIALIRENR